MKFKSILISVLFALITILLVSCSVFKPSVPVNQNSACSILKEHRSWKRLLIRSKRKWGIPVEVQMAVIWKESSFRSRAKPPRNKVLWVIPGKRPTSAKGYAQAVDGTWDLYKRKAGGRFARRTSFKHSADFIGWYLNDAHEKLNIQKSDAYNLYLAYHEGINGYAQKNYKSKSGLLKSAKQVENKASTFKKQLKKC